MRKFFKLTAFILAAVTAGTACLFVAGCDNKLKIEVPQIPKGLTLVDENIDNPTMASDTYTDYALDGVRRSSDALLKYYGSEEESYERVENGVKSTLYRFSESGLDFKFKKENGSHAEITSAYKSEKKTTESGNTVEDFYTELTNEGCQSGGTVELIETGRKVNKNDKGGEEKLAYYYQSNEQKNAQEVLDYYLGISQMVMYSNFSKISTEYFTDFVSYYHRSQYNKPDECVYSYYPDGANHEKDVVMKVSKYDCTALTDATHMYFTYERTFTETLNKDGISFNRKVTNKAVVYVDIAAGNDVASFKTSAITDSNTRKVNYVQCDTAAVAEAFKRNEPFEVSLLGGTAGVKSDVAVNVTVIYYNGSYGSNKSYNFPDGGNKLTVNPADFADRDRAGTLRITAVGTGSSQSPTMIVVKL